jgi:hypothetical protein
MWKQTFPMARTQNDPPADKRQFKPRTRLCLLKGCERPFCPAYPGSRYCSTECRKCARCWVQARARERYRQSPRGKERRQEQSQRYRCRCKERGKCCDDPRGCTEQSEGHPREDTDGFLCKRAGCFLRVRLTRRSPLQKYCSAQCCRAVRRVRERERRWRSYIDRGFG